MKILASFTVVPKAYDYFHEMYEQGGILKNVMVPSSISSTFLVFWTQLLGEDKIKNLGRFSPILTFALVLFGIWFMRHISQTCFFELEKPVERSWMICSQITTSPAYAKESHGGVYSSWKKWKKLEPHSL